MHTVFDYQLFFAGQAQVGLVDEGGGLQGVIGALLAQVISGQAAQFAIDDREQLVEGFTVSLAPR